VISVQGTRKSLEDRPKEVFQKRGKRLSSLLGSEMVQVRKKNGQFIGVHETYGWFRTMVSAQTCGETALKLNLSTKSSSGKETSRGRIDTTPFWEAPPKASGGPIIVPGGRARSPKEGGRLHSLAHCGHAGMEEMGER